MEEEIIKKIEKIEKLLASIKKDLKKIDTESNHVEANLSQGLDLETIIKEYDSLYEDYINGNFSSINNFVNKYTKPQLQIIFKRKHIPIEVTTTSKKEIIKKITQLMNERKLITK